MESHNYAACIWSMIAYRTSVDIIGNNIIVISFKFVFPFELVNHRPESIKMLTIWFGYSRACLAKISAFCAYIVFLKTWIVVKISYFFFSKTFGDEIVFEPFCFVSIGFINVYLVVYAEDIIFGYTHNVRNFTVLAYSNFESFESFYLINNC